MTWGSCGVTLWTPSHALKTNLNLKKSQSKYLMVINIQRDHNMIFNTKHSTQINQLFILKYYISTARPSHQCGYLVEKKGNQPSLKKLTNRPAHRPTSAMKRVKKTYHNFENENQATR